MVEATDARCRRHALAALVLCPIAVAVVMADGSRAASQAAVSSSQVPADSASQDSTQASTGTATEVPVFKSHTDLVFLQVNVFDERSNAVERLPASAFTVYEDNRPQDVQLFEDLEVPVTVGLVIDNSTSMLTRRQMVRAGVEAFADFAGKNDEMFTIVFNEHVRLGNPTGPFTRSRDAVLASLVRFPAGGRTALHDAVVEALAHIEGASNQKRVIVVLSDGDDNASRQSRANMLHRASRSQALIYTIWTGDLAGHLGDQGLLRRLADGSGGVAYRPRHERDVVAAFAEVGRNVRRGYGLGYVPTNQEPDGGYRRVKVVARADGKPLKVRVREGYTAGDGDERPD